MKECIFHFKLIRGGTSQPLRALIMLPPDKKPAIPDFLEAFRQLGYDVRLDNEHDLIFTPVGGSDYKLDITRIELKGDLDDDAPYDKELRAILEHLIRN